MLAARNAAYGVAMAPTFAGASLRRRVVAAQLVIDESTAMATAQEGRRAREEAFWLTGVAVFVGRGEQLHALRQMRHAVTEGMPRTAIVYGPSGIGKSALIRQFVRAAASDAMVLSGRCYENESVPYKALDGLIDDLSRCLAARPGDDVRNLLPPDVVALTRLFPVLLQVKAIETSVRRTARALDPDPPHGAERRPRSVRQVAARRVGGDDVRSRVLLRVGPSGADSPGDVRLESLPLVEVKHVVPDACHRGEDRRRARRVRSGARGAKSKALSDAGVDR